MIPMSSPASTELRLCVRIYQQQLQTISYTTPGESLIFETLLTYLQRDREGKMSFYFRQRAEKFLVYILTCDVSLSTKSRDIRVIAYIYDHPVDQIGLK